MDSRAHRKISISSVLACVASFASANLSAGNAVLNESQTLYIDRFGDVARVVNTLSGDDRANASAISGFPIAAWFTGGTPAEVRAKVSKLIAAAGAENKVPVLVAYNVPFRDCAQYSAGGAKDTAAYKAWIDGVAAGIGQGRAVVLLEPDGLGIIPHHTDINGKKEWCQPAELNAATAASDRYEQINYAVDTMSKLKNTVVYLDGTHSGWLSVGDIANRLVKAGVQKTAGFFVNVSNYQFTSHLQTYGAWVTKCIHYGTNTAEGGWRVGHFERCVSPPSPAKPGDFDFGSMTDRWFTDNVDHAANAPTPKTLKHFVVDTSRNGRGPWIATANKYSDPQVWCNPPGRGIGDRPTTRTGDPLLDAKLWVKVPGESDGQCTRGTSGPADPERGMIDPPAGRWFKEQAEELIRFAQPALTITRPNQ